MAKRFTDSNKFGDIWYRKLPLLQKVLWEFLLAECNHAGILTNFDLEMASFKIGADITKKDLEIFESRVIFITENTLFIPKFLEFQYGEFNPKNRVHLNVLKELDKFDISASWTERKRSVDASKEKEQEQEKEKEKEIDTKLYGEYLNVNLNNEQYGKLLAMCASEKLLNELIDSFSIKIEVGKERPYQADLPNAHFERIKSYYNWRKKNPEKFAKECSRPDSKTYKPDKVTITAEERADIAAIQARIKSRRVS
jgi:hypothetical protein